MNRQDKSTALLFSLDEVCESESRSDMHPVSATHEAQTETLFVSDDECEIIGREVCRQSFAAFTSVQYRELGRRYLTTVGGWYLFFVNRARALRQGTANADNSLIAGKSSITESPSVSLSSAGGSGGCQPLPGQDEILTNLIQSSSASSNNCTDETDTLMTCEVSCSIN